MKKITGALIIFVVLLVGAGVGWAGKTILTPPPEVAQVAEYSLVKADQGTISSSIKLDGAASWKQTPHGINNATGVVTEVRITESAEVKPCDVLYLVNEQPVVIAQGEVPAFRALGFKSSGRDVVQLQKMLHTCGFLANEGDGKYGAGTVRAVKAWQKSLGVTQTGSVDLGSIIFVTNLPTQALLDPTKVTVGAALTGGETVLSTLDEAPVFYSSISDRQVDSLEQGLDVVLSTMAGTFEATIAEIHFDDTANSYIVTYGPVADQPICGALCSEFSVDAPTKIGVEIVVIEPIDGIVVPVAALGTSADGKQVVVTQDGERVAVQVQSQARGQAVVTGLETGTTVRVPGEAVTGEPVESEPDA